MTFQQLNRLSKMDQLIALKNTGTPLELSQKLKISERATRQYLHLLKELGAPIAYSRKKATYFYKEDGCFGFLFMKSG